jgi:hypothetical protein
MKFKRGESNSESINKSLVEIQRIDDYSYENIRVLQGLRRYIFDIIDDLEDVQRIRELNNFLTQLEFRLQGLWGFKKDENYHRWWDVPKCSCPKWDNQDLIGTSNRIYSNDCILHGK